MSEQFEQPDQITDIEAQIESLVQQQVQEDEDRQDPAESEDAINGLEDRVSVLEDAVMVMAPQLPTGEHDPIFLARVTAFTSGTAGTWQEQYASGTTMADMTMGRFTSAATNPAALFGPPETGCLLVEQEQPTSMSAMAVFPGLVDVY